jgi:hypothetical protein
MREELADFSSGLRPGVAIVGAMITGNAREQTF